MFSQWRSDKAEETKMKKMMSDSLEARCVELKAWRLYNDWFLGTACPGAPLSPEEEVELVDSLDELESELKAGVFKVRPLSKVGFMAKLKPNDGTFEGT